jgi:hypothetical protein
MKVDNLTRVRLEFRSCKPRQAELLNLTGPPVEFIFGIGRDGLSRFEADLQHKDVGETISCSINGSTCHEYFGHLYPLVCGRLVLPDGPGAVDLEFSVSEVSRPDNREIVEAMARSIGHGCGGGSCDCGCS